jgi:CheY-like chemotaxis protein
MLDRLPPEVVAELRHELRTPVNIISGYSEMLLEDADQAEWAGSPLEAALRGLSAEMREVLKLVGSALPPSAASVEVAALVGLAEALDGHRHRAQGLVTDALAHAGDPAVRDDLDRIQRAIGGLAVAPAWSARTPAMGLEVIVSAPMAPAAWPARVLVVDDVEDNRSVLSRRLERMGHTVLTAGDGDAALARARDEGSTLDLILLDMRMPGRDGHATLLELKADERTRDIPVVMISALDDLTNTARCIAHGAEDYLPKPFDPLLLAARVGATLDRKRLRDRERDFLEQTMRVIDAARSVEEGCYDPAVLATIAQRGDELGRLARVFDGMAAEVRARESRLQAQLDALRQEIGAVRGERSAAAGDADDPGPGPAGDPAGGDGASTLRVGQCLAGRYDVFDVAGQGGMGRVFRATDRELGGEVAIKTIRAEALEETPDLRDWLKSEVRLSRRITHPNVVRTYDFGETEGLAFITMEYVDGVSLRSLMASRGTLASGASIAFGAQLFRALQAAHEQGVVHRDIKPENVLLSSEGMLKVMDFGIARLVEGLDGSAADGYGTLAYMAPEQLLNEPVDARADLYAAGVVLYEALTGHLPFDAASAPVLLSQLLTTEPVPASTRNPEVSEALAGLLTHLLAADAAARPASARQVVSALEGMR